MAPLKHRFCLSLAAGLTPSGIRTIAGTSEFKNEPSKNIFTKGWANTILKWPDLMGYYRGKFQKWKFNMRFILNKGQSGDWLIKCFWTF
jgi:hypothetical protein